MILFMAQSVILIIFFSVVENVYGLICTLLCVLGCLHRFVLFLFRCSWIYVCREYVVYIGTFIIPLVIIFMFTLSFKVRENNIKYKRASKTFILWARNYIIFSLKLVENAKRKPGFMYWMHNFGTVVSIKMIQKHHRLSAIFGWHKIDHRWWCTKIVPSFIFMC